MDLSSAAWQLPKSPTLAMNERIARMRERGEEILHMGFGESPFPAHPRIQRALIDNAWRRSYLPTQGILPLREQVSIFYQTMLGLHYDSDQIVIGPGSKSLMFAALAALEGPVFLPAPSWVSYQHMAKFLGREVHHIPTDPENSYRLTPSELDEALRKNTLANPNQKILVLNYPCNPTGHSFSKWQLRELSSVAREHNVAVLSDEIYALTTYHDHRHHSIAEFYPEGTLITGGLSKDRSLGGYRLGVLLLPEGEEKLLNSIVGIGSEIWSCVSSPIQYAAVEAYGTDRELLTYIRDCATIHELVTKYAHTRIREAHVDCASPQGAFYLFPDWRNYREPLKAMGVVTSEDLSEHLLVEHKVAALPGSDFGMSQDDLSLRLSTVDYDGKEAYDLFLLERKNALNDSNWFVNKAAPRVVQACTQIAAFTSQMHAQAKSTIATV
nr:MAG: hypothetical protein AM324_06100 [Candidatus Thorarchaeota archaeon SMTZ1-83]